MQCKPNSCESMGNDSGQFGSKANVWQEIGDRDNSSTTMFFYFLSTQWDPMTILTLRHPLCHPLHFSMAIAGDPEWSLSASSSQTLPLCSKFGCFWAAPKKIGKGNPTKVVANYFFSIFFIGFWYDIISYYINYVLVIVPIGMFTFFFFHPLVRLLEG